MTALLEYLDLFIQIQVAEKLSSQCRTVSPWVLALLTAAIDSIMCGTVMLSMIVKNSGCQNSGLLSLNY